MVTKKENKKSHKSVDEKRSQDEAQQPDTQQPDEEQPETAQRPDAQEPGEAQQPDTDPPDDIQQPDAQPPAETAAHGTPEDIYANDDEVVWERAPGSEDGDVEHVEGEEVDSTSGKKRKTKKPKSGGKGKKKPTEQEVLQRLLEKNEVILQLSHKNVQLDSQVKSLSDKRVQLMAEFENYRKRTRKEWDLLKDQTKAEVLTEFLAVVDDFDRAMAAMGERDDEFVQGVRLIYNGLLTTLERLGVRKMIALGESFDPNLHMAVASIDSENVESNHVVEVIQEGYLMDGNVIRPANVVIAK